MFTVNSFAWIKARLCLCDGAWASSAVQAASLKSDTCWEAPAFYPHAAVIHAFLWRQEWSCGGRGGRGGWGRIAGVISSPEDMSLLRHSRLYRGSQAGQLPLCLVFLHLSHLLKLKDNFFLSCFLRLWALNPRLVAPCRDWWWTCSSLAQPDNYVLYCAALCHKVRLHKPSI